jgi:hypothetical protein
MLKMSFNGNICLDLQNNYTFSTLIINMEVINKTKEITAASAAIRFFSITVETSNNIIIVYNMATRWIG